MRDVSAGRLEIAVQMLGRAIVVRAEGEVDLDNAEDFASAVRGAATESAAAVVVVDLIGVPFMDSSGLKVLLVCASELGDRLRLALSPGSPVLRLLELAEVRDRFAIHATPEEAAAVAPGDSA